MHCGAALGHLRRGPSGVKETQPRPSSPVNDSTHSQHSPRPLLSEATETGWGAGWGRGEPFVEEKKHPAPPVAICKAIP